MIETTGRDGWQSVRLGDICAINARQVDPTQPDYAQLPHICGENIAIGNGRLLYVRTASEDGMTSPKYLFKTGDVLYSKLRPYLRKVVRAEFTGVCSADMYPIEVDEKVLDGEYARWLLLSDSFTNYAVEESRRARMPKLNRDQLFAFEMQLPPLDDQRRIASRLADGLASVERARSAAKGQLEAARGLSAATLRSVFFGTTGHGWPLVPLGEIAALLPSKSIATAGDTEVLAITTACLSEDGFRPSGIKRARMARGDVDQCVASPGEILIARSNTPELVGRVSMFPGSPQSVVASDLTVRIRTGSLCRPDYLTAFLSYLYLAGHWKDAGGASGSMKKITRTQIEAIRVPCPTLEEQERIGGEIAEKQGGITRLIGSLADQRAAIDQLPAALLRRAFNGEL